jgi:RNA polymerase sigma factor (sigma-70 family)
MVTGLQQVQEQLEQASSLTDGVLLARFVATRDEDSFEALVRRHGPMVLGVCRRLLGLHDAEDVFQATFLVLARKAASVAKRESVGCWLHGVARHTALRAVRALHRRRKREKQVKVMPHPEVPEEDDWLSVLDEELSHLPEKYRAAIVLCDLEGRTRREAALLLKIPEGTLSSRLAAGRKMLATRVALAGGVLSVAVPAGLVTSTVQAATGQEVVSALALVLTKEVMKVMLLKKLWLVLGSVTTLVVLGVAFGFQQEETPGAGQGPIPGKPLSELEALRKENELLKLNLQVVLEKVRNLEAELRELRKQGPGKPGMRPGAPAQEDLPLPRQPGAGAPAPKGPAPGGAPMRDSVLLPLPGSETPDPLQEAEAALKQLREARDKEAQRRAAEALEKAIKPFKGSVGK